MYREGDDVDGDHCWGGDVRAEGGNGMTKRTNEADATRPVRYVDPDGLHRNPAFTNVVVVEGPVTTVYVGGQNSVDASGNIVGKGDIATQTE